MEQRQINSGMVRDLAEHLRSVQFALLITCGAVAAALSLSLQPQNVRDAIADAKRIAELTTDDEWRTVWRRYALEETAIAKVGRQDWPVSRLERCVHWQGNAYSATWSISTRDAGLVIFANHADDKVFLSLNPRTSSVNVVSPPRSLGEFIDFWDDTGTTMDLRPLVPAARAAISDSANKVTPPVDADGDYALIDCAGAGTVNEAFELDSGTLHRFESGRFERASQSNMAFTYEGTQLGGALQGDRVRIVVDAVSFDSQVLSPAAWLGRRYEPRWLAGRFENAFPALSSLSGNDRGMLLTELRDRVQTVARSSQQPLQLFGMSIPAQALTWWGPIVILSVQLYFLVHFRALSALANAAELVYPWIALYDDRLARLVFITSAVALPPLAVAFAIVRTIFLRLSATELSLQVVALAFALVLAAKTHAAAKGVRERSAPRPTA